MKICKLHSTNWYFLVWNTTPYRKKLFYYTCVLSSKILSTQFSSISCFKVCLRALKQINYLELQDLILFYFCDNGYNIFELWKSKYQLNKLLSWACFKECEVEQNINLSMKLSSLTNMSGWGASFNKAFRLL